MTAYRTVRSLSLAGLAVFAFLAACSSDPAPPSPNANDDAGDNSHATHGGPVDDDAGDASTRADAGDSGKPTHEQCIAACEAQYPAGSTKGKAIDDCMSTKCSAECASADPDGQIHGPTSGDCKNGVGTPSATCSQCVVANCCTVWDSCFGDTQCKSLNECASACEGEQ